MDFEIDDPKDDSLLLSPINKHSKIDKYQDNIEIVDNDDIDKFIDEPDEEEDNSIPLLKHDERKSELEMECLMLNNSNILKESLSQLSVKDSEKWEITKESKYLKILQDSFDEVYPLFYLNNEQRKYLQEKISSSKKFAISFVAI